MHPSSARRNNPSCVSASSKPQPLSWAQRREARKSRKLHAGVALRHEPNSWTTTEIDDTLRRLGLRLVDLACLKNEDGPRALEIVFLRREVFTANGNDHVAYVFSSVALLRTLRYLSNQSYIKLCGDGTFKCVFGKWCVITLGALSKQYAATRKTSTFHFPDGRLISRRSSTESAPGRQQGLTSPGWSRSSTALARSSAGT